MVDTPRQLFDLGRCGITPGAAAALEAVGLDAAVFLHRHASGDWGKHGTFTDTEVTDRERQFGAFATDDDAKLNRLAVEQNNGSRIMSEYRLIITTKSSQSEQKVVVPEWVTNPNLQASFRDDAERSRLWISTEGTGEHRNTIVMMPSEY
jgi:hypothetical protein